jgi:hypothetical protein
LHISRVQRLVHLLAHPRDGCLARISPSCPPRLPSWNPSLPTDTQLVSRRVSPPDRKNKNWGGRTEFPSAFAASLFLVPGRPRMGGQEGESEVRGTAAVCGTTCPSAAPSSC